MNNYTNFLPESYAEELQSRRDMYMKHYSNSGQDALSEMSKIAMRESSKGYIRFGLYWWALKDVLMRNDDLLDIGNETNKVVGGIYKGDTDIDTLILAFIFRDWYDQSQFQGSDIFQSSDDFQYHLVDHDMITLS